jgi:hypothetical protein
VSCAVARKRQNGREQLRNRNRRQAPSSIISILPAWSARASLLCSPDGGAKVDLNSSAVSLNTRKPLEGLRNERANGSLQHCNAPNWPIFGLWNGKDDSTTVEVDTTMVVVPIDFPAPPFFGLNPAQLKLPRLATLLSPMKQLQQCVIDELVTLQCAPLSRMVASIAKRGLRLQHVANFPPCHNFRLTYQHRAGSKRGRVRCRAQESLAADRPQRCTAHPFL